jgi:hypothetical protein
VAVSIGEVTTERPSCLPAQLRRRLHGDFFTAAVRADQALGRARRIGNSPSQQKGNSLNVALFGDEAPVPNEDCCMHAGEGSCENGFACFEPVISFL